jgi:magnesium transporter
VLHALLPDGLRRLDATPGGEAAALEQARWIDLLEPTEAELRLAESVLGIELPTRKEAQEIELSSRLYVDGNVEVMTLAVALHAGTAIPEPTPVTFAYHPRRLVTLRFADTTPFRTFTVKMQRAPQSFPTPQKLFIALVDEIVDRAADILELVAGDLSAISRTVFGEHPLSPAPGRDYGSVLARIGQNGERAAVVRESLVSAARLVGFFSETHRPDSEALDPHWATVGKDVAALTEHATFLVGKVNFALDATQGRINSEQNTIIKLFSVLAVVFLPPTLIASIYGMNFDHIPELRWLLGYPFSLGLMLAAAVLPYLYFKRKGWF